MDNRYYEQISCSHEYMGARRNFRGGATQERAPLKDKKGLPPPPGEKIAKRPPIKRKNVK